jgi:hypothetical protein
MIPGIGSALAALLVGGLVLIVSLVVAIQARRRGYSLLTWVVAGMLVNPIFLLVLLGVLPDRRRKRLREKETEDLEHRLLRPPRHREEAAAPVALPVRPGAIRAGLDRSLGDMPTNLPERSLGDEETRM